MNKHFLILILAGLILCISSAFSQNALLKIGHANLVDILEALPETDSAQQLIDKDTKELELMLEEMQNRIQTFQQNAAQQLQQRGAELMQPVCERIQQAVNAIGKREGYTYILDSSKGSIVFTGEASNDIESLIREELGIAND